MAPGGSHPLHEDQGGNRSIESPRDGHQTLLWTQHAEQRINERRLTRDEVEQAIREGHSDRAPNRGDADWRIHGTRADGRTFAVIYDNPVNGDRTAVEIVSVWPLRRVRRRS